VAFEAFMNNRLLKIFTSQLKLQCKFMIRADIDVKLALQNNDVEGVFYGLQNLLNASANISKALWGQGGQLGSQRKPLREVLLVTENSPLSQVKMRNNFEHFDERIDRWWLTSKNMNFVDSNVMPENAISGIETGDIFRNYDPETTELVFWGQKINIASLVKEAERILSDIDAQG